MAVRSAFIYTVMIYIFFSLICKWILFHKLFDLNIKKVKLLWMQKQYLVSFIKLEKI